MLDSTSRARPSVAPNSCIASAAGSSSPTSSSQIPFAPQPWLAFLAPPFPSAPAVPHVPVALEAAHFCLCPLKLPLPFTSFLSQDTRGVGVRSVRNSSTASSTSQGNLQHDGAAVAITVDVAALAFVHHVPVSLVVLPVKALIPVGELEVVHLQSKSAFVSTYLEIISFASLYWSASEIFWLRCSATSPGSISTKIPVLSPLLSSSLKSTIRRLVFIFHFSTMQVTS